jgi:hypothetical protein
MAQIKKKTVKDLLESYANKTAKFTPVQFITLLGVLTRRKDGTISEFTQKMLAPLYMELTANRLPHVGLVLMVLEKLNKPFFRRKKNQDGGKEEVEEVSKTPGTRVKASNFMSTKSTVVKTTDADLRKKLDDQWRKNLADAYKAGSRDLHIKSVGNGL